MLAREQSTQLREDDMQGIWNKSGFILRADWIRDGKIIRTDQFPTLQGRTSNRDDNYVYDVCLSVVGGKIASEFTKGAIMLVAAALGIVAAPAAGAAFAAGTTAGAVAGTAGGGLLGTLSSMGIPDPITVFYTGKPSTTNYLDVWGTVWSPQYANGGSLH